MRGCRRRSAGTPGPRLGLAGGLHRPAGDREVIPRRKGSAQKVWEGSKTFFFHFLGGGESLGFASLYPTCTIFIFIPKDTTRPSLRHSQAVAGKASNERGPSCGKVNSEVQARLATQPPAAWRSRRFTQPPANSYEP